MKGFYVGCLLSLMAGCSSRTSVRPESRLTESASKDASAPPENETAFSDEASATGPTYKKETGAIAGPPEPSEPAPSAEEYSEEVKQAFEKAREAWKSGDLEASEQALLKALRQNPRTHLALTNLGVLFERRGQLDKAEAHYRKALELKPSQIQAWDFLSRLALRRGRAAQCEQEAQSAIARDSKLPGPRAALANLYIHQRKFSEAAWEIKQALKTDEKNVRAMEILAHVYYLEGKYELARMVLENARAIDPQYASVHNGLGLVNLALKSRQAAVENFKEAATLQPGFAEARNNYGLMLLEGQDFEKAAQELEAAVFLAPDFLAARLNLANAYRGLLNPTRALPLYQEVVRRTPDLLDVYFNLGVLHLDAELPSLETSDRLRASIRYFEEFNNRGGKDERVAQYVKEAQRGLEKEERRKEREKKDALKKAERANEEAAAPEVSPVPDNQAPAAESNP